MSRRRKVEKHTYGLDPRYHSTLVNIVVSRLIQSGNKKRSYNIVYSTLSQVGEKTKREPLAILEHAVTQVTPKVQLKTRRVGGTVYQVPTEVLPHRGTAIAIQWLIRSARTRTNRNIVLKLSAEIMDAARGVGGAVRKREEVQRMAEINKAFARYRFLKFHIHTKDYFYMQYQSGIYPIQATRKFICLKHKGNSKILMC